MQETPNFTSENPAAKSVEKPKEKANAFFLSIIALLIVLIFTGAMFGLKMMRQSSIDAANTEKVSIDNTIKTLKSDKKNTVAALLEGNSIPSIQLTPLVVQFKQLATSSQVQFTGFNIQNNTITTNLTATNSDKDAVQKIITLMKTFAKNGQQGTFALEPILSISGNRTTRTTPVTFKIVPIKTENATENTNSGATAQ